MENQKLNFEKTLLWLFDEGNETGDFKLFDLNCKFYIEKFGQESFDKFIEENI